MTNNETDKPIYRVSYLSEFEYCSYAWYLHHIGERRGLGSFYTARGTGCHAARELNMQQKVKTYKDLPLEPMQDAARDEINRLVAEDEVDLRTENLDGLGKKAAAGRIIDATMRLVEIDRNKLQSRMQPREVEVGILIRLPDWPFDISMRLDSIDVDRFVTDLKTAKSKWTQDKAERAYQPKVYKLGYLAHCNNDHFAGFRYHIVVCTPRQQRLSAYPLVVNPTDAQVLAVIERFEAMHNSITRGVFVPCHRGSWKCQAEYCNFFRYCKYV